jgi:DNA-binding CsgD family transcriptional regulator
MIGLLEGLKKGVGGLSLAARAGRFLLRPYALSGHRWAPASTVLCCIALAGVFVAEIGTPVTVVASFSLVPVLAAAWLLSTRWAALIAIVAAAFFILSVVFEPRNTWTLIVVAIVTLSVAATVRLHAASLAGLLSRSDDRAGVVGQTFEGIQSLTPRELDVARLAAEGRRAADISAHLHIGERTVESHLSSIYSKLGINSKSQLIRIASALPGDIPHTVRR